MNQQVTDEAFRAFSEAMGTTSELKDGALSIRVIGEFSSGKTRLLNVLFGEKIPVKLQPISSRERQTLLPLELTYGDSPRLSVVERRCEAVAGTFVQQLHQFPNREKLKSLKLDPLTHRLRLEVDEPRLVLPQGDGYSEEEEPKRLFLVDMPGWNSADTALEENPLADQAYGEWNLALVYVAHANRLDSRLNREQLENFIQAITDDATFIGTQTLIYVVTHCPAEEREAIVAQESERIRACLEQMSFSDEWDLRVHGVDFSSMSSGQEVAFREELWGDLLRPLPEQQEGNCDWAKQIEKWPQEWDIRPKLESVARAIEQFKGILSKLKQDGEYIRAMNMTRLTGLTQAQRTEKLWTAWQRQLGINEDKLAVAPIDLDIPDGHPLEHWWISYWVPNTKELIGQIEQLYGLSNSTLLELPEGVKDLQQYFRGRLDAAYVDAQLAIASSFSLLGQSVGQMANAPLAQVIATSLALSQIDMRYRSGNV